jgi:hypothetical protein
MSDTRKGKVWIVALSTILAAFAFSVPAGAGKGLDVAVIAHSVSTRQEASKMCHRQGWTETSLQQANAILVVCRSGPDYPLGNSYDSIKELDEAAASQLNTSGSDFHVYIFLINDDHSVFQVRHISYSADGW